MINYIKTYAKVGFDKLKYSFLGIFIIPIEVFKKNYALKYSSVANKEIYLFTSDKMVPWNNLEDGIVAGEEYPDKPLWFRILYWSIVRNPANGMRYMSKYLLLPDSSQVKFKLKHKNGFVATEKDTHLYQELDYHEEMGEFWYFASQCDYANFRWEFKLFNRYWRFWIGFKIYPSNVYKIHNYQIHGIGSTIQIKQVTRFK